MKPRSQVGWSSMALEDDSSGAAGGTRLQEALRRRSGGRGVAVFTLDMHGRVASWNPDAQRVEGYLADEVLGRHFSMFYPPEVPGEYPDEELARAAETGVHVDEGWRVRRDGTRFWAYVVIAAQRSAHGSVRGFLKVVRDDTAFHLSHQRAQRFSDLLDLAPVGVGLFDQHERVREANDALCRLTGYSRPELLDMHATDLLLPGERGDGLTPENVGERVQRTVVRRDGDEVTCEISRVTSVQDDGREFQLVVFLDVTARIREAELLQHQATHDALTGLPNRRGVEPLLREPTANTAVLLCDIDNFKRVNDAFGHAAGDELMVQIADDLRAADLPGCTVARLSGDEFLVVCADVTAAGGLQALADEAARALHRTTSVRGHLVRVSASIGAALPPPGAATGEDLLRYADVAMYEAKTRGRRQVVLAAGRAMQEVGEQVRLEEELAEALRTDGLELHHQPIVDAARIPIATEALVRWRHPERGRLSPAEILPAAEQAGLMGELDRWVLGAALRQVARWPATAQVPVSVNLSRHTAGDPDFLGTVEEALAGTGVAPELLVLEITETSLVDLSAETVRGIEQLIARGVRFAVDDFGSGYSSLARLKVLPPVTIKLDRQFVAGVEDDAFDRAIVRSAVDLAHATGRRCVVEGVETAAQFRELRDLGVDGFQGFLFSRPLPAGEIRAVLERRGPMPLRGGGS